MLLEFRAWSAFEAAGCGDERIGASKRRDIQRRSGRGLVAALAFEVDWGAVAECLSDDRMVGVFDSGSNF